MIDGRSSINDVTGIIVVIEVGEESVKIAGIFSPEPRTLEEIQLYIRPLTFEETKT